MDFLVGAWDTAYARTPERPAGRDVYALSLDGCALMEHWTSPDGREIGMSVNAYDRSAGVWRYVFTDSVGAWTQMDGVWDGAVFRYEGEAADRSSGGLTRIRARMELAPMADGRVQQTYFTQSEAGDWAPRYQVVMTRRD
ncbi:hypothetical protein U91I_03764 [alpha proteobacterium U9-1i]|nr:hypothetical protein U91I_03764 [alpha proteobacterium U9-1i]